MDLIQVCFDLVIHCTSVKLNQCSTHTDNTYEPQQTQFKTEIQSPYSHALTPRFTLHASHLRSITVVQGPQWGMLGVLSAVRVENETPHTC